ncbi:hypothetical protein [Flexithrix dorotheae]|uniref:hypothetical protein n=1 Tax=Flexithrix dorotheae TaxID=70993 RepID=UPI0003686692|nr:hypothetical protein [Flexithrix dorotheae]
MKKAFLSSIVFLFILIGSSSCLKDHNQAVVSSPTPENERVWGNKGGEPRQLPNKYEADESGATADRIQKIREKLYSE